MVPEGWKESCLLSLLMGGIKNGYSPNPAEKETGYWVLGLGALGDEGIIPNGIKPVDPTEKVLQNLLDPGDFLISRSNTPDKVGRSLRYKGEIPRCSYPDLMMRFRIDEEKADPDFIEHKLKSKEIRAYFKACAAGSSASMVKINKGTVEKTPIHLPPLSEQKKIAQILTTWERAIAIAGKLLENSLHQKKAMIQKLLTGKQRLQNFSGNWKELTVSELLSVRRDKKVPDRNSPLFSLTIEDGITKKTDRYDREFLVKDTSEKKYKLVKPKDIVFNPANLRWGAINFSRLDHDVVVSPIYEVLYATDPTTTNLEFVAYALMSDSQIAKFAAMVEGTLMERKAVKIEPFLSTKILIPPSLLEQQKIASVLANAVQEIQILQTKLACLKHEKEALMQQLLTGKRRVTVDAKEAM